MRLPDYITALNLLSGLLAILATLDGHYVLAGWLIVAGAFFDAIDGWVARKLHVESDFGAELDSLADLITFGVAPMILLAGYYQSRTMFIIGMILPLMGALRLARHNINRHQTKGFLIGVPITMSAIVVPLLVWLQFNITVAGIATVILGLLFASTIRVNKLLH